MPSRLAVLFAAAVVAFGSPPSAQTRAAANPPGATAAETASADVRIGGRVAVPRVYRSIHDFGLRGDDRSREGPLLNRAIASFSRQGGGHLVIPSGRTVFAGATRILLRANVSLEGDGAGGGGIRWGPRNHERGIQLLEPNSAVRDLVLTGAARGDGRQQIAAWMDGPLRDVVIEGNRFRGWHVAVAVRTFRGRSPTDFSITGNRIAPPVRWRRASQVQVISMINRSPLERLARFRVDRNDLGGAPNGGIFIDGGRDFSISSNRIVSTTGPKIAGSSIGVYTEFGGDTIRGVVAGNTILGSGREVAAIELNAGLDEIEVVDNVAVEPRLGVAYYPGIEGDPYPRSHDVVIRGNRVYRPGIAGFLVDGAADHITLEGNLVVDPRSDGFHLNVHPRGTQGAAVLAMRLRENVVVSRSASTGFSVGDTVRVAFSGNTVCHPAGARAPAIGLQVAPSVARLEGRDNRLEGHVAPMRDQGRRSTVSRRLTSVQYSAPTGCPPFAAERP